MTKDFENEVPGDEGSDATASGPDSQEDSLTVDDILGAEQTDDAAIAEASDEDKDLLLDLKRVQAEYANYRRAHRGAAPGRDRPRQGLGGQGPAARAR